MQASSLCNPAACHTTIEMSPCKPAEVGSGRRSELGWRLWDWQL